MGRKDIYKDAVPFKPQGDIPPGAELAKRPLTVKVLVEVDTAIRELPEMSAWLRRVITEAAKRELLGESPAPVESATPATVETTPGLDTVEVVGLLEDALTMTKVKDIKAIIGKLWAMFTTGADETVSEIGVSSTPLDTPPVDNRKLLEVKTMVEGRLAEGTVPKRDYKIYSAVKTFLESLE